MPPKSASKRPLSRGRSTKVAKGNPSLVEAVAATPTPAPDGEAGNVDTFENSMVLMQHCCFHPRNSSITSIHSEDSLSMSNELSLHLGPDGKPRQENSTIAAVKRGYRWQVLCALALSQTALGYKLRVRRLRAALEKLMLPKMLEFKEAKGHIFNKEVFRHAKNARQKREFDPQIPHVKVVEDSCSLFESFKSSTLMQSLAGVMSVEEVPAGRIVASFGHRSQDMMRFLVFGKVVYRPRRTDAELEDDNSADNQIHFAAASPAKAPLASNDDGEESAEVLPRQKVLKVGDTIGGIFGTTALFDGSYKTISKCIFWCLKRADFDEVFLPYADDGMKASYRDAFKEHCVQLIEQAYPISKSLMRVPIYRKINRPMSRYKDDFKPCVFLRGETLFDQDEGPGDVFCMLEGTVRRRRRGFDKSFNTGVSHLLTLNCFSGATGRFTLLGADPLIMPATHRHQCSVMSRYALFFRISGERFVSALLDDPNLYVLLRERLTQLIRTSMRLDPACLSFAPLLREFPESSLAAIAQAAEPRVLRRSVPLCEPAQSIKEIFLIVRGDIRDTRVFGKQPTKRLDTPPPQEDEDNEDDKRGRAGLGRGGVNFSIKKLVKSGNISKSDTLNSTIGSKKSKKLDALAEEFEQNLNFFSSPAVDFSRLLTVTPDEQSELNPPLPIMLDKRFEITVGGGWEGLLVDKWPSGWEGICTLEAWALPTLRIRMEFNNLPKPQQSSILMNARLQQKEALGLSRVMIARLPPMSSYQAPEKSVKGVPIPGPEIGADQNSSQMKKKAAGVSVSRMRSAELSQSRHAHSEESTDSFGENFVQMLGSENPPKKPEEKPKPKKKRKKAEEKDPSVAKDKKEDALPELKVTIPSEKVKIRRPRMAPAAPPPVNPFLLAVYNGEYKDGELALTNIVRDPPTPKKHDMRHCTDLADSQQRTNWPSISHPKKRWFATVPSYEPLPGTINNANVVLEPPTFSTNTDLMTRKDRYYREKLVAETEFFTSSMKSRQQLLSFAGESFDLKGAGGTSPSPEDRPKTGTQEFPKRHALI